jgi:ABC-type antimicrobial peptide transport system permease subunit
MTVVVRVRGEPTTLADDLRGAIRRAAPGLAVPEIRSLGWHVRRATAEPRFQALLAGVFAVAGLALALVGVYGVTAFAVSRRRREMGIRMTLGGDPSSLRRMVLLQSARLAVTGAALGAVGAWWIARALTGLLYETEPGDPVTWATVTVLVVTTTLASAWIPARRATGIEPREVLAAE